ncbi:MAG: histidine phosphatase family protein [Saprospiraceae bacterium]
MQKFIFVVRHAKSSWANDEKDINRPLNDRGLEDAPKMAKLFSSLIKDDLKIISSPANRALTTANFFRDACNLKEEIEINEDLYFGSEEDYLIAAQNTDNKFNAVAIFGHNPKIEYFCSKVKNSYNENIPTCAILKFSCKVSNWKEVEWNSLHLDEYFFPKEI